MAIFKLGSTDRDSIPSNLSDFLIPYHRGMIAALLNKKQFRGEANNEWQSIAPLDGKGVRDLQQFLLESGFFPNTELTGIFGYGTLAATRLFQEYVRTMEKDTSIGVPDGVAGPKTLAHIQRWRDQGKRCVWGDTSSQHPSKAYKTWMRILHQAKAHYLEVDNPVLDQIRSYPEACDTFPPEAWLFDPCSTHLVGIRRNVDKSADNRANDDIFVLLIRGMVFYFWGSTDPNARLASRGDEAFLVEGQHRYKFGWHKVSSAEKIYKALRPATNGVLVFRDKEGVNALTGENIAHGLDKPNTTINIHWSGDGDFNFSAGCQVIAGKSYINQDNETVDCRQFASDSYSGLSAGKTRGAYNVLSDLVVCYTDLGLNELWYTMGREENLSEIGAELGPDFTTSLLQRMQRQA
jgi:hypothetical protein